MNSAFPLQKTFSVLDKEISYEDVHKILSEKLSPARIDKIKKVAASRLIGPHIVTEKITDVGNINAVMRSAENLGFPSLSIIEAEKMKYSNRITQGADKWLISERYKNTETCIRELKSKSYQIVVTVLSDKAKNLDEIDFSIPTAIVFGNEKRGASPELQAMADIDCIIPSSGFSQSFNISVAAAIIMYHVQYKFGSKLLPTSEEQKILEAFYMLRTCKSPHLYF
jgi:tRNA (guanosine-2'-O-)-methyltransferase